MVNNLKLYFSDRSAIVENKILSSNNFLKPLFFEVLTGMYLNKNVINNFNINSYYFKKLTSIQSKILNEYYSSTSKSDQEILDKINNIELAFILKHMSTLEHKLNISTFEEIYIGNFIAIFVLLKDKDFINDDFNDISQSINQP